MEAAANTASSTGSAEVSMVSPSVVSSVVEKVSAAVLEELLELPQAAADSSRQADRSRENIFFILQVPFLSWSGKLRFYTAVTDYVIFA
jgi:hypothetical protein